MSRPGTPSLLRAMKATLSQGDAVDVPGQRYGLGLGSFPTPCGTAWGHNGAQPGYVIFAYTSTNGRHQAVLMVNLDVRSWPAAVGPRFYGLIQSAYCGAR